MPTIPTIPKLFEHICVVPNKMFHVRKCRCTAGLMWFPRRVLVTSKAGGSVYTYLLNAFQNTT